MDEHMDEYLDNILDELEMVHIPQEFVTAGKVTSTDGEIYMITPDELQEIMDLVKDGETMESQGLREIRLIINMTAIKETISELATEILSFGTDTQ